MDVTGDDLAGIADLFGALTRDELGEALAELAFKRGDAYDPTAFSADIDAALDSFHLVAVDATAIAKSADDGSENEAAASDDVASSAAYLIAGPVAFPTLPEGATDLVHILDVPDRSVDREAAGEEAIETYREAVDDATAGDDADNAHTLVEVSYELEAWADVDLSDVRDQLTAETE